jgi:putative FmdB family regulatory protein
MPLFEYQCQACGHRFEALVTGSRRPVCPRCHREELEKLVSTFGVGGSTASGSGPAGRPSCGPVG